MRLDENSLVISCNLLHFDNFGWLNLLTHILLHPITYKQLELYHVNLLPFDNFVCLKFLLLAHWLAKPHITHTLLCPITCG